MAQDREIDFLYGGGVKTFPFVGVPQSACPQWGAASVTAAQRARGAWGVVKVGDSDALVLPGKMSTACFVNDGCGYLVRWAKWKDGDHSDRVKRMIASVKDTQWKAHGTFDLTDTPLLVFSAAPSHYKQSQRWEMPDNHYAGAMVVKLPKGTYDVHVAEHVTGERTAMDIVRLRPPGKKAVAPVAKAVDPARAAIEKAAAKVRWIDSEGGPFVVVPSALRKAWRGAKDFDTGNSDFARACAVEKAGTTLLAIGEGQGLVIAGPDRATAFALDDAWLFVTEHEAKDVAAAHEAARNVPEKSWKRVKGRLVLPRGGVELRDASAVGSTPSVKAPIPEGTYEVSRVTVKKPGVFLSVVRVREAR